MQELTPKDRPKVIALGVVAVLVIGFGVKTTMDTMASVSGGARPAATPTPAVVVVPGATPAAGGAATTAANPGAYVLGSGYGSTSGRDPFTPVSDAEFAKYGVKVPELIPAPVPSPTPIIGGTGIANRGVFKALAQGMQNYQNRNDDLKKIGDEINGVSKLPVPPPTYQVLPPAAPPYTVTGVLIGEPGGRDVAILSRNSGGDKKFVVVGDSLEGGYTVTAIESGGVRVKHPGRRPVTSTIPGAPPVAINGTTEYYLPKQTTVVPATSVTLPLEPAPAPGAATDSPRAR